MNGAVRGVVRGVTLSSENDLPPRDRWARLRFAIIGPLLAAPPAAGSLHEALTGLAAKIWRHPFTGLDVRFGVSTIERWLYAAKKAADPVRVRIPPKVNADSSSS
jgi:putative transposase